MTGDCQDGPISTDDTNTTDADDSGAESGPLFTDFVMDDRLHAAIAELGFVKPTPIQVEAIPPLLEGRDLLGQARTGSGKTAAFGLPLLQRVRDGGRGVRALVLAPTRELAQQVCRALTELAGDLPVDILPIFGGASYTPQLRALKRGVPVVVATPGRLIDHMERGTISLDTLEMLVLDEADEMLRMGFLEEVQRVFDAAPDDVQVALFSATMPREIRRVAADRLTDPVEIQVEAGALTADHIEQRWVLVPQGNKLEALERLLASETRGATLVFARTRANCGDLADALATNGWSADAMHGDLNQAARERVLRSLRNGKLDVLVATDVAARGLDVDLLSHVVNLDLPRSAETYVHRIGRTGRAGRKGTAITFVTPREQGKLQWLQKQLGKPIENIAVPSDLDIARRRRSELAEALNAVGPEDEDAHAWLAHLLEQDGSDVHAIAAAALRLIADADRVPLTRDLNPKPPRWAKPPRTQQRNERPLRPHQRDRGDFTRDERQREPRGHRDQHVELFFPIGRRHGLRPQDVVGALTRELGVPGHLIGRVTIVEFKTFVGLPAAVAHDVLKAKNIILRGRDLRLVLARPSGRR